MLDANDTCVSPSPSCRLAACSLLSLFFSAKNDAQRLSSEIIAEVKDSHICTVRIDLSRARPRDPAIILAAALLDDIKERL